MNREETKRIGQTNSDRDRKEQKDRKEFRLRVKLQIGTDEPVLGPGVAELLELVGETGSMKEACGRMGMSYSKGWKIVNRAETELGYALILRKHGGRSGGSCALTPESSSLVRRYRALEERVKQYADAAFQEAFAEL